MSQPAPTKSSILTFSRTRNTIKVAGAVAAGLLSAGFEVEQVPFRRRRHWNPGPAGLVGVGCPACDLCGTCVAECPGQGIHIREKKIEVRAPGTTGGSR